MPSHPDPTTPWWKKWEGFDYLPSAFGKIFGGHSVQEAVYGTLQTWLPTYIKELNRKLGGNILEIPKDYRFRPEVSTNPREVEAKVLVDVPGLAREPHRTNAGYRSIWTVKILVFVYGPSDWQETQALTYAYGTCVRSALLQHQSLGGLAESLMWKNEQYREGEGGMVGTRTTGLATIELEVGIAQTIDEYAGPPDPLYAPDGSPTEPSLLAYPLPPTVKTQDIDVQSL